MTSPAIPPPIGPPPIRSAHLRAALDRELSAGNALIEWAGGSGGMPLMVLLAGPFRAAHGPELVRREVNDPHWWQAELSDPETGEILACRA